MTLFFGLMNAKKNPLSNNLIIETKKVFVGHVGVDGLVEKKQDYFYCLGFDSGAFKCPAVIDDKSNSSFSLLTGEPLISGKSSAAHASRQSCRKDSSSIEFSVSLSFNSCRYWDKVATM